MSVKESIARPPNLEVVKLVAVVAMICDHFNWIILDSASRLLDAIGVSAFPLFCWLLVFNYLFHSRHRGAYINRLWLWAAISQLPYQWALGFPWPAVRLNIFVTLALGLMYIRLLEKVPVHHTVSIVLAVAWGAAGIDTTIEGEGAQWLEGGVCGVALFGCLYLLYRGDISYLIMPLMWVSIFVHFLVLDGVLAPISVIMLAAALFYSHVVRLDISCIRRAKLAFYMVYPLHLILLKVLSRYIKVYVL